MNELSLTDVITELHVPDFEITKYFYGELGFETVWEYPPIRENDKILIP